MSIVYGDGVFCSFDVADVDHRLDGSTRKNALVKMISKSTSANCFRSCLVEIVCDDDDGDFYDGDDDGGGGGVCRISSSFFSFHVSMANSSDDRASMWFETKTKNWERGSAERRSSSSLAVI